MLILNSPETTQQHCLNWKAKHKIALVPTMGCLHEGHLALIKKARSLATKVVVSIFVNPLQFGPNEDFDKYPRSFEKDCTLLKELNVDLVFHPSVNALYPEGYETKVHTGQVTHALCGKFREGHFDGVATVCLKLFQVTQADFAVFGEKDFQQLRCVEQMACDFNLPISIIAYPTVRENDGLALSSRNTYLTEVDRKKASSIPTILNLLKAEALQHPDRLISVLLHNAKESFTQAGLEIQYLEITGGQKLIPALSNWKIRDIINPRFFIAVFAGKTRLIDNISLE